MAVTWLKKKYRVTDTVKTRNKPSSANSGKSNKKANARKGPIIRHPNDEPVILVLHIDGRKRLYKQSDYGKR